MSLRAEAIAQKAGILADLERQMRELAALRRAVSLQMTLRSRREKVMPIAVRRGGGRRHPTRS
jgi:hypothetical protein